jgi:hypothetical protein
MSHYTDDYLNGAFSSPKAFGGAGVSLLKSVQLYISINYYNFNVSLKLTL